MSNYRFGNYVCELRIKKGLSQSQLGEKLGVTNKAVSRWENGSAYPSTELMFPLARELGVSIEELYKVISEDKTPKTKLRRFLESLMQYSKTITIVCLILTVAPYLLFVCFSNIEDKFTMSVIASIVVTIVYVMFRFMFVLLRKNPFASTKVLDIYTIIILVAMTIAYIPLLKDFVPKSPNGFNFSLSIIPTAFMAVIHTLKRRYG